MGSSERSRKKLHMWKKAIFHFLLCFVMGFFTGFAPISKTSVFSSHITMSVSSLTTEQPVEVFHDMEKTQNFNRSMLDESESEPESELKNNDTVTVPEEEGEEEEKVDARRLLIIVTPTSVRNKKARGVLLRRLANTLRLVAQPLLWIVVERQSDDDSMVSGLLRKTGIMYRHVVFKENFTDLNMEMDHQKNMALNHIEHHRLSGIVHFAGLSNVYDLAFFEEVREIGAFGAWPIARLAANRKRVIIEGPVCDSSEVVGWHLRKMNNLTDTTSPPPLHISSFAFNSSILWDPERWGRASSVQDTSQNSLRFVRKEVLEEETNLKGIPAHDCSKVMLWDLKIFKDNTWNK